MRCHEGGKIAGQGGFCKMLRCGRISQLCKGRGRGKLLCRAAARGGIGQGCCCARDNVVAIADPHGPDLIERGGGPVKVARSIHGKHELGVDGASAVVIGMFTCGR